MTTLVPRRSRSLINEFMGDPFEMFFGTVPTQRATSSLMKTDVKQTPTGYELVIDLPGFSKDNVTAEIKDGVLTVTAQTKTEETKEDSEGTWVRKERFSGHCSRSFYVGEEIEGGDIRARFENGTLLVSVPRKQEQPKLDEATSIAIEG